MVKILLKYSVISCTTGATRIEVKSLSSVFPVFCSAALIWKDKEFKCYVSTEEAHIQESVQAINTPSVSPLFTLFSLILFVSVCLPAEITVAALQ